MIQMPHSHKESNEEIRRIIRRVKSIHFYSELPVAMSDAQIYYECIKNSVNGDSIR